MDTLKRRNAVPMKNPDAPSPPRPVLPLAQLFVAELGASSSGAGPSIDGAACHEQSMSGKERSTTSEGSEEEMESGNDTKSNEESEGSKRHSGDERVHDESDASEGPVPSGPPFATAPARESPGQEQVPAGPETLLTADALAARAAAMFDVGRSAPQASGHPPCGSQATKELLLLAFQAANDLCDKLGKALSKAFGNFDRVVALGWLLGDAVGAPLLARDCAHAVGLKARRAAGDIKTDPSWRRPSARRGVRPRGAARMSRSGRSSPRRRRPQRRRCCALP